MKIQLGNNEIDPARKESHLTLFLRMDSDGYVHLVSEQMEPDGELRRLSEVVITPEGDLVVCNGGRLANDYEIKHRSHMTSRSSLPGTE